jgi:cyanate lyase
MNKSEMTTLALSAKKSKGLTWQELSAKVGMGEVWVASVLYGENSAPPAVAKKLAEVLDLGEEGASAMSAFPMKGGSLGSTIPTDPLIYRFYEIMLVYGQTIKDIIHEKFGDGIMSAIDFKMDIAREEDPKGDRVIVTMNGKFLPYKTW